MQLPKDRKNLKEFLDVKVAQYNQPSFIPNDPVAIPHSFSKAEDIEISGLFAAVLAWGQRKTILNKCRELMTRLDNSPHDFILNHSEEDLKNLLGFKHRTFNDTDLLYFVEVLKWVYTKYASLEAIFINEGRLATEKNIAAGLVNFHNIFFSLPNAPSRTRKHIATPARNSACKRLAMYLRWMVRPADGGVDFGLWQNISPAQLICPCDVHVDRVGRELGLIERKQTDWKTALQLTEALRAFDSEDPVKYDYALFGLGVEEAFGKN
jgi:uncharacterized protein (TIGR02757 family)